MGWSGKASEKEPVEADLQEQCSKQRKCQAHAKTPRQE